MFNGIAPIGVFDSGLGGMSVAAAIRRRLPNEAIVYVADSGFRPMAKRRMPSSRRAAARWRSG